MKSVELQDAQPLLFYIKEKYGYRFDQYAKASILRRVEFALEKLKASSVSEILDMLMNNKITIYQLVGYLTVPTTDFFRDADFFLNFRNQVVPLLKTFSRPKLWIAGCSSGEEVISYAIILMEERILDRCTLFATDINPKCLDVLRGKTYKLDRIKNSYENYFKAGGKESFASYFSEKNNFCCFTDDLFENLVIAEHCLAVAEAFSEVQFISCRNTLIYFEAVLQEKVLNLFYNNLETSGIMALGNQESIYDDQLKKYHFKRLVKPNFYRKIG